MTKAKKALLKKQEEEEAKAREADSFRERGNEEFKVKNYHKAIQLYTRALESNPKDGQIYSNRAAAFELSGNLLAAKLDAVKAFQLEPDQPKGYYRVIKINIALKCFGPAHAELTEGLQKFPDDVILKLLEKDLSKAEEMAAIVSIDGPVLGLTGFPPALTVNPHSTAVLASGQSDDGSVKLWAGFVEHPDHAPTVNVADWTATVEFNVLLLNSSTGLLQVSLGNLSTWKLELKNGSHYTPSAGSRIVEIRGTDVTSQGLQQAELASKDWLVCRIPFNICNTGSDISLLKRCRRLKGVIGGGEHRAVGVQCTVSLDACRAFFKDPLGSPHEEALFSHILLVSREGSDAPHTPLALDQLTYTHLCERLAALPGSEQKQVAKVVVEKGGEAVASDEDLTRLGVSELTKIRVAFH